MFAALAFLAHTSGRAQSQRIVYYQPGTGLKTTLWKTPAGMTPFRHTAAQKGTQNVPRLSANYDGTGTTGGAYANHDSSTYRYTTVAHLGFDLTGNVPQATANGTILTGDYDTATSYTWSAASSSYVPDFRIINLYDAQNRQVRQFFQTWASGTWSDFSRYSTYYNAAGNDTLSVSEDWNSTTSSWTPTDRFITTYDMAGNAIKEINQNWNTATSAWTNYNLDSFAYDANHNETYQLQQNWSAYHNSWYNFSQASFIYSATSAEQDVKSQNYDTLSNTWKNDYHAHYYYNTSDQVIAATTQNGSGVSWINSDSASYTLLDAAGLPLNTLSFVWTSGAWNPDYRITTTNAGAGSPFVAVFEQWNGTAYVNNSRSTSYYNSYNKPTAIYTEHWTGSTWAINASDNAKRYYYDLITTGVNNVAAGTPDIQVYLYPIPASEKINLAVHCAHPQQCTGTICDALGRQVAQWTGKAGEFATREISVAALPAGQYYLRLQGNAECLTKTFTVAH